MQNNRNCNILVPHFQLLRHFSHYLDVVSTKSSPSVLRLYLSLKRMFILDIKRYYQWEKNHPFYVPDNIKISRYLHSMQLESHHWSLWTQYNFGHHESQTCSIKRTPVLLGHIFFFS